MEPLFRRVVNSFQKELAKNPLPRFLFINALYPSRCCTSRHDTPNLCSVVKQPLFQRPIQPQGPSRGRFLCSISKYRLPLPSPPFSFFSVHPSFPPPPLTWSPSSKRDEEEAFDREYRSRDRFETRLMRRYFRRKVRRRVEGGWMKREEKTMVNSRTVENKKRKEGRGSIESRDRTAKPQRAFR